MNIFKEPEVWKPIPGYEGLYEVSSWGNVKSLFRMVKHPDKGLRSVSEKILKKTYSKGYPGVNLSNKSIIKRIPIHKIVALVFINNDKESIVVNHIDGDKSNNYFKNLEWSSVRENTSHFFISKNKTSKYVGVYYDKSLRGEKKWIAMISFQGKKIRLGRFYDEELARKSYLDALKKYELENKYATESQ